ncbi:MAG: 2,3,4,5-tetrahydropyridine-2,6-dicarboxylate N-succinyltransferase [Calditrichaeota bacterium]|nr:MAG: 2,3,4,5-tetrahydropyridine-2,6-dicarboxylate N-succinyltransferase [Calditrichota bacterium]
MNLREIEQSVTLAYDNRELLSQSQYHDAIRDTIEMLDKGRLRVAEKKGNDWIVNQWVKKAILLYFQIQEIQKMEMGPFEFYDKIPLKKDYEKLQVRVVPPGVARYGSYLAPGVVLMPGYVNIGAFVDSYSMVDTHATVGSCAQVGKGVHIAGAARIGGVLEPPQSRPVIIEDYAFIGSAVSVMEGVIVREEAVLGAGVILTSSTKIIDVSGSEPKELQGEIPPRSVVIPGSYTKNFPAGKFQVQCALIIGKRKESTDKKVSLNEALRDFNISV